MKPWQRITNPPHKRCLLRKRRTVSQGWRVQQKNGIVSKGNVSLVSKSSPLFSTPSTVSSWLSMDFLLATDNHRTSKPKKKAHRIKSMMKQEPKLAAYNVDWFNSTSTKNKCLKHTSNKNLPVTQEGEITFLLDKYQTSKIKTAFADVIGKVGFLPTSSS